MKRKYLIILFILFSISLFSSSIGWGNLQWPLTISILQGETTENIYGQVWMDNVTPGAGQGAGITAELGYGTDGSTPGATWNWFTATYFGESGSNDEYIYNLECTMAAGIYDYTYRYHYENDPADDYYYAAEIGDLTVNLVPPPTYDVTFQVDMQYQTVAPEGVFIAGSFNGWSTDATPLDPPTRDNIYSVTLQLESGNYEYKYINGSEWENIGNRNVDTPEEALIIPAVFFNDFSGGTSQDVTVTFQVYLGNLDPAWYSDGVSVQGNVLPLNWNAGDNLMTDSGDLVYTADILFPAGSDFDVEYKFTRDDGEERIWYWEDSSNRPFIIDDSGSTQVLEIMYWNDSVPVPQNVIVEIMGDNIQISWDSVFGANNYNVYRSTDPYGDFGTPINFLPITGTLYTDNEAALQTKYFYQVKAIH